MLNKIIGFTISKIKINYDVDVFNSGLSEIKLFQNGLYVHLWGVGNLDNCKINDSFSLSFPLSSSLETRNVVIYFEKGEIIVENDWLSSIPIFYNKSRMIVSTLFNICLDGKNINSPGLKNFFSTGHSIYGETPFKEIKFLRYYSKLKINKTKISVSYKPDNFSDTIIESEVDSINYIIKLKLNKLPKNANFILPLSGGYDSRYLGCFLNADKVSSYTYGLTKKPKDSFETKLASKVSKKLGFKHKVIEINNFSNFIEPWHSIFGSSTHLHGMYQIDFYNKISKLEKNKQNKILISGIVGDLWAGKFSYFDLKKDLNKFFLSHGTKIQGFNITERNNEFYQNKNSKKYQIVDLIRSKMILLSYLMTVPEYFGMISYSPFLEKEVALGMISLPDQLRRRRKWQEIFFKKQKINFKTLFYERRNTLDLESILNENFEKLNKDLFPFVSENILNEINEIIIEKKIKKIDKLIAKIYCYPYAGYLLRLIGLKSKIFRSFNNYIIIKSIDKSFI